MANETKWVLLRIYLSETEPEKKSGRPAYKWIVETASALGLAGATVLRGMMGFGAHHKMHSAKLVRLAEDMPVVVEIIDTGEKIESFIPKLDGIDCLITSEQVTVYRIPEKD